jgi:hypothetical protein
VVREAEEMVEGAREVAAVEGVARVVPWEAVRVAMQDLVEMGVATWVAAMGVAMVVAAEVAVKEEAREAAGRGVAMVAVMGVVMVGEEMEAVKVVAVREGELVVVMVEGVTVEDWVAAMVVAAREAVKVEGVVAATAVVVRVEVKVVEVKVVGQVGVKEEQKEDDVEAKKEVARGEEVMAEGGTAGGAVMEAVRAVVAMEVVTVEAVTVEVAMVVARAEERVGAAMAVDREEGEGSVEEVRARAMEPMEGEVPLVEAQAAAIHTSIAMATQ